MHRRTAIDELHAGDVISLRTGERFRMERIHQRAGNRRVPKAERVPDFVRGHLENIESGGVTTETDLPVIGDVVVHVTGGRQTIVRREKTVRQNTKAISTREDPQSSMTLRIAKATPPPSRHEVGPRTNAEADVAASAPPFRTLSGNLGSRRAEMDTSRQKHASGHAARPAVYE
jgi:hypothetical protein